MLRSFKAQHFAALGRRSITSTNAPHPRDISESTKHTNPLRKSSRGGQDLSSRWKRLENTLRQKTALSNKLEAFSEYDASNPESSQKAHLVAGLTRPVPLFHGFQVPEEPKPPAEDECCMSGCAVCVYDLYEESLEAYQEAVAALRMSLASLQIPEAEWPAQIRPKDATANTGQWPRNDVILNAFEEMERQLGLKNKKDSGANASNSVDSTHWKKRQQLAEKKKAQLSRANFLNDLYEGIRWALFSGR